MKKYIRIITTGFVVAIVSGCTSMGKQVDMPEQKEATYTRASDVAWANSDLGVKLFGVFGDSSKGPHITYVKFKAGQATPPHTHTGSYTGVILEGTGRHYLPGRPETKMDLPIGSTWFMPANVEHVSECMPGSECIFVVYQQGHFDFHPVKK